MKLIKKQNSGSVLVFALIVLFIGVVAALGITSTTIISQKISGTTGKSVQSFQVADSGAEIFLKTIKDVESSTRLKDLVGLVCDNSTGIMTGNIGTGKDYSIIAYDSDEREIKNCNASISDITKIKSIGTHANTSRAIELAVASDIEGITGGCMNMQMSGLQIVEKYGKGCKDNGTSISGYGCSDVATTGYECGLTFYLGGGSQMWGCTCSKE